MVEKKRRLAVARFWYEGNSFSPALADRAAFERREWLKGQEALDKTAQESELRAVIAFKDRHPDWDVEVFRCASASPAGQIDDEIFSAFLDETIADLTGKAFDAIYLSLHGAGVTTLREDPEVDLLRAIRKIQPTVPIGASFDLHGNLANELATYLTTGSVYRTYPHIDMRETAWRVLDVLQRTVASTKACCCRASTCAPRTGRCATCRSLQPPSATIRPCSKRPCSAGSRSPTRPAPAAAPWS
jgi:microcystin degradation protein MlrC